MTEKTDWNSYYQKPYKTSGFSKPIIIKKVLAYIKKYAPMDKSFTITEFGGGNSCFYSPFQATFSPEKYYIVDNNAIGLEAFRTRFGQQENTHLLNRDILDFKGDWQSDIVFSVGLIEHFSVEDTRHAILAHLQVLKEGGIVIIGFPTPTFLYRVARKISELIGLWIFMDERPLKKEEVLHTLSPFGQVLEAEILWPIVFTQAFIVLRKSKNEPIRQ